MLRIVAWRVPTGVPLLFVVSFVVFGLSALMPGDAADTIAGPTATPEQVSLIRAQLGLDHTFWQQYWSWLTGVLRGDFGQSVTGLGSVGKDIVERLPVTLSLTIVATILSVLVGVAVGAAAAIRGGVLDRVVTAISSAALALPEFWIGVLLVSALALHAHVFPATGYTPLTTDPVGWLRGIALPSIALAIPGSAHLARLTRAAVADVASHGYLRTATAIGLPRRVVVVRYLLRSASIPVVTVLGIRISLLLGGAFIVESVFGLAGVGSLMVQAVQGRDLPIIQGVTVFIAVIIVVVNLLVDVAYGALDPRARTQ